MRPIATGLLVALASSLVVAQEYGAPDRGEPGDAAVQAYLGRLAAAADARFAEDLRSLEDWQAKRPRHREEYLHMLGLWPLPEKTPLQATVTGTREGDGFVVEKLHFQSRPHLYVTANLYRPKAIASGERLPAVLYVCGHSGMGRNGNKTAFQSHGVWFARHGYVALLLDTLQLGEIAAYHHGTYREQRWWWHSRGYTPAGVECWNGIRGIDYLQGRGDVDPERIAVTGISGGGAATFWIAAADERVRAAAPVSGMADLESYVSNRVINGHCDCMFLYNAFEWPWTRIASLVAPRPLFFVNSDKDAIFPMDANDRIINRLERLYSLYGAGEKVDALVSIGGHDYRADIRKGVYRFINTHLKNDPLEVGDSEVDLVLREGNERRHPIPPEELRVFAADDSLPKDELNTTIDQHFVPMAKVAAPRQGEFEGWKKALVDELRRVSFGSLPERVPPATLKDRVSDKKALLETEPGIVVALHDPTPSSGDDAPERVVLEVGAAGDSSALDDAVDRLFPRRPAEGPKVARFSLDVRGAGQSRWTRKNPPNFVERSHVLLGRTVDASRVRDIIAAARWLHARYRGKARVAVVGSEANGILAAYAALFEPEIAETALVRPLSSLMDEKAPQFLNALRVCDVPEVLGMLAPRRLHVHKPPLAARERVAAIYAAAGAREALWAGEAP
jgi:dienelactone hydrolase